ncbi:MAG: M28 family peptidase [Clostridia bacterium]|nr:M28 family peptidase [Clostridia bacterium]
MTETNKTILENYQIRKTRKQKSVFISFLEDCASSLGYTHKVERASFGSRNVVVGNIEKAEVVFSAHYDTQPVLPFPNFITPKSLPIYLIYQLVLSLLILLAPALLTLALGVPLGFLLDGFGVGVEDRYYVFYLIYCFLLWVAVILLMFGPANKHTANDNTSGVTALLETMEKLPENLRDKAAFVFFDNEELGLIGSSSFYSKHKNTMKNKLLINFDCVSDGENMLFAVKKGARKYVPYIEKAYEARGGFSVEICTRGVIYPSDQILFPMGVGACALRKSKILGILYMNRIHTPLDTLYNEENISFFADGSVKLVEAFANNLELF